MCSSRKTNSIPLYIWRVLELMSRQVILSIYFCSYVMLIYVVGEIYGIPVYKIVQRVLVFATVGSYILTVGGHNLVSVSIWYSSLCSVVLLSCFWRISKILDAVEMEQTFFEAEISRWNNKILYLVFCRLEKHFRSKGTLMQIWKSVCLDTKIMYGRYHIITLFTFWDIHARDM